MDSAEAVSNNNLYPCKQGLSGWMKNLGRLGNTTNLEEYGASPPETDNTFLGDYHISKQDNTDLKESILTSSTEDITGKSSGGSFSNSFLYDPQLSSRVEQSHPHLPLPALSSLLLESFTDDTSSSADTTPFVTPQGSPLIPRRILEGVHNSLAKEVAAQSTRKWLYKGLVTEGNDVTIPTTVPKKQIKKPGTISPTLKKCNISNFDINALSPSSW